MNGLEHAAVLCSWKWAREIAKAVGKVGAEEAVEVED